jgi:hypothetical protein
VLFFSTSSYLMCATPNSFLAVPKFHCTIFPVCYFLPIVPVTHWHWCCGLQAASQHWVPCVLVQISCYVCTYLVWLATVVQNLQSAFNAFFVTVSGTNLKWKGWRKINCGLISLLLTGIKKQQSEACADKGSVLCGQYQICKNMWKGNIKQ